MIKMNKRLSEIHLNNGEESGPLCMRFDKLPVEILQEIFRMLPPMFLQRSMRLVCSRFALILSDDMFWKKLFKMNFKTEDDYPLLSLVGLNEDKIWRNGTDVSWRDLTVAMNERAHLWGRSDSEKNCLVFTRPHSAFINAVKIISNGELMVSGGRDKMMCLWKLPQLVCESGETNPTPVSINHRAHEGWVWGIASCERDKFYTCGWDARVKLWDIERGVECVKSVNTAQPAMAISCRPGLLVAGLHSGNVMLVDPRVAVANAIHSYKAHKRTLTDSMLWENSVISIGEDRTMTLYDLRSHQIVLTQSSNLLAGGETTDYPRSLGIHRDILYVGDARGTISLYGLREGVKPHFCISTGQERIVHVLKPNLAGVIACCGDGTVRFLQPSTPSTILKEIRADLDITNLDYHRGVLVCCASNNIYLYTP